ncbi:hypothetical protein FHS89_001184 [Rubricella aquisinus]|jgi:hypothetical protein|uniref:Uncharacterized protein n=1 Tax=Rubricella aquisinus TaxID=2028108 RepID=A0A840WXS5_9RHOB|nr:hypothetical protein [Rubricella aquisinus]MBB5515174.1 hypothetical protein [Rubricella aquisinus]
MENATPTTLHEAIARGRAARSEAAYDGIAAIRDFIRELVSGRDTAFGRHA